MPTGSAVKLWLTIIGASAGLSLICVFLISAGMDKSGRPGIPLSDAIKSFPLVFAIVLAVAVLSTWYDNRQR